MPHDARTPIHGVSIAHLFRRLENDEVALRSGWPASIHASLCSVPAPESLYPWIFACDAPSVPKSTLRSLTLLCKLLEDLSTVVETGGTAGAQRACALQFESAAILASILPGNRDIWTELRRELSDFLWACDEQARPMNACAGELSRGEADALTIARCKAFVPRVAARTLHALAATDTKPLLRSIDAYVEAQAMFASLRTWRDDVNGRRFSVLTARLRHAAPTLFADMTTDDDTASDIARFVFGHLAQPLLKDTLEHCESALIHAGETLRADTWGRIVGGLASHARDLDAEVRRMTKRSASSETRIAHIPA